MTEDDYNTAISEVQRAVELNRRMGNLSGVYHTISKQLGVCFAKENRQLEARTCFAESLEGYRALKDLRGLAELFAEYADVFPINEDSACLLGAAHTINIAVSARPKANQQHIARCRAALGDAAFDAKAWKKGINRINAEQAADIAESIFRSVLATN